MVNIRYFSFQIPSLYDTTIVDKIRSSIISKTYDKEEYEES